MKQDESPKNILSEAKLYTSKNSFPLSDGGYGGPSYHRKVLKSDSISYNNIHFRNYGMQPYFMLDEDLTPEKTEKIRKFFKKMA